MAALLDVQHLSVSYGAIKAVRDISFHIEEGTIVTMIGANGAGKSTVMNTLAGVVRCATGQMFFAGEEVTACSPDQMVRKGLTLCPEGRQIFPRLTVRENILLGGYTIPEQKKQTNMEKMLDLFPRLRERLDQMGGTLSGGEQQMLAVARALMSEPKLLMLDEPSLGLAPIIVQELFALFQQVNQMGTTIFLVEQNASMALSISHHGYVLETGKIVLHDSGENLKNNPKVQEAYLGGSVG